MPLPSLYKSDGRREPKPKRKLPKQKHQKQKLRRQNLLRLRLKKSQRENLRQPLKLILLASQKRKASEPLNCY